MSFPPSSHHHFSYNFLILILTLILFGMFVLVFYPGYVTADTIYILMQGIGQVEVSNWHSPAITKLWGSVYKTFRGTQAIWLIQIAFFVLSLVIFSRTLRSGVLRFLCVLIALYPPLFTNMAAIWKDNWAISSTLFCLFFSYRSGVSPSFRDFALTSIFFIIATLIRIDYFVVTFPCVLFATYMNFHYGKKTVFIRNKSFLTSIFLVLLLFFLSLKSFGLMVEKKLNPWVTIAAWDVAGTHYFSSDYMVDGYNCRTSDPLVFGGAQPFKVNLPEGALLRPVEDEAREVKALWFAEITSHPVSYLRHRMCVGKTFLGLDTPYVHYPFPSPVFSQHALAAKMNRSQLNHDLYWFFDAHAHGFMYRYWVYLVLTALLFILLISFKRCYDRDVIFGTSICLTIFAAASRFMILPASDFRYGLWIVLGTMVLLLYVLDVLFSKIHVMRKENFLPWF